MGLGTHKSEIVSLVTKRQVNNMVEFFRANPDRHLIGQLATLADGTVSAIYGATCFCFMGKLILDNGPVNVWPLSDQISKMTDIPGILSLNDSRHLTLPEKLDVLELASAGLEG